MLQDRAERDLQSYCKPNLLLLVRVWTEYKVVNGSGGRAKPQSGLQDWICEHAL